MEERERIKDLFVRQYDYFQYLFEVEQKRAASIIAGAKVYIAFLVFILGSIFLKVLSIDKIRRLFTDNSITQFEKYLGILFSILSALALFVALIFSILVLKIWSYDRLCNPAIRFKDTLYMKDEIEVLSKCISDFAVATSRNNEINNKRARFLSFGLVFLITGTILSLLTAFILRVITIVR